MADHGAGRRDEPRLSRISNEPNAVATTRAPTIRAHELFSSLIWSQIMSPRQSTRRQPKS